MIADPSMLIKEELVRCRKALVRADGEAWDKVVQACLKSNLFTLLDKSEVARDSYGQPILNGAFAVQKSVLQFYRAGSAGRGQAPAVASLR